MAASDRFFITVFAEKCRNSLLAVVVRTKTRRFLKLASRQGLNWTRRTFLRGGQLLEVLEDFHHSRKAKILPLSG